MKLSPSKLSNLSPLKRNVLKLTIWLIYVFIIFELGTRLFFYISNKDINEYRNLSFDWPKIFTKDLNTQYRMRSHAEGSAMVSNFIIKYNTNNYGLRDHEISREKKRYRILFLGDSMTFGVGVQTGKRFSDIVGNAYPAVETINAGVPGYGIHQMANWYKYYGKDINAELVLCAIIGSDIDRAVSYNLRKMGKNDINQEKSFSNFDNNFLVNYFHHALDVLSNYARRVNNRLKSSYFYSYCRVKFKLLEATYLEKKKEEKEWRIAHKERGQSINRDFKDEYRKNIARKVFNDLQKITYQRGAKLAVVNIDVFQIDWLSELLKDLDISYIDISPYLVNETNIRFNIDPHYNLKGNRLVGDALIEEIRDYIPDRFKEQPQQFIVH